ncbi:MAG: DUF1566 domain-containing protein [SAR324 cluster bacterium]|nr:DUF1566 domain-containing protein [SAR324 cluster bacterium]
MAGLYERKTLLKSYDSSYYWASTTYASGTSNAWYVYFGSGYVDYDNKTSYGYVRCVRGGQ